MKKIEYRVRPVTRYVVTRWEAEDSGSGSVQGLGEFDNEQLATRAMAAFAYKEFPDPTMAQQEDGSIRLELTHLVPRGEPTNSPSA